MAQGQSTKIILMIKCIRTSGLSIKKSLSALLFPKRLLEASRRCLHPGDRGSSTFISLGLRRKGLLRVCIEIGKEEGEETPAPKTRTFFLLTDYI